MRTGSSVRLNIIAYATQLPRTSHRIASEACESATHHSSPVAPACFKRVLVRARLRPPLFVSFLSIAARFTVLVRAWFCGRRRFLLVAFFVRVATLLLLRVDRHHDFAVLDASHHCLLNRVLTLWVNSLNHSEFRPKQLQRIRQGLALCDFRKSMICLRTAGSATPL